MMRVKKIVRGRNFTVREERILLSLVTKYKERLSCKKTDNVSSNKKWNCWKKLTQEFNILSDEPHRDLKNLKNKYDNMKKRLTQKVENRKSYAQEPVEDPPQDINFLNTKIEVEDLVDTELAGALSQYDDDMCPEDKKEGHMEDALTDEECDTGIDLVDLPNDDLEPLTSKNLTDFSAQNLRLSDLLQTKDKTPQKEPLLSKLEKWCTFKVDSAMLQKTQTIELHKLKMQHLKEIHQKQLNLMERESNERMRIMGEEHECKLKKLGL